VNKTTRVMRVWQCCYDGDIDGYKALAAAIIAQALDDIEAGDKPEDAQEFLESKWRITLEDYLHTK